MDITIYYTENFSDAPIAIERITTPLESEWDRRRVYFAPVEKDGKKGWMLSIDKYQKNQKGILVWFCAPNYCPLFHECGNISEYQAWLEKNVSHIEVDGRIFWANPSLSEGDE